MKIKSFNLLKINFIEELRPFNSAYRNGFGRRIALSRKISSVWIGYSFFKKWAKDVLLPKSKIKPRYRFLNVRRGLKSFRYLKKFNKIYKLNCINKYNLNNLIYNPSEFNKLKGLKYIKKANIKNNLKKNNKKYSPGLYSKLNSKLNYFNSNKLKVSKVGLPLIKTVRKLPFFFKSILNEKNKKTNRFFYLDYLKSLLPQDLELQIKRNNRKPLLGNYSKGKKKETLDLSILKVLPKSKKSRLKKTTKRTQVKLKKRKKIIPKLIPKLITKLKVQLYKQINSISKQQQPILYSYQYKIFRELSIIITNMEKMEAKFKNAKIKKQLIRVIPTIKKFQRINFSRLSESEYHFFMKIIRLNILSRKELKQRGKVLFRSISSKLKKIEKKKNEVKVQVRKKKKEQKKITINSKKLQALAKRIKNLAKERSTHRNLYTLTRVLKKEFILKKEITVAKRNRIREINTNILKGIDNRRGLIKGIIKEIKNINKEIYNLKKWGLTNPRELIKILPEKPKKTFFKRFNLKYRTSFTISHKKLKKRISALKKTIGKNNTNNLKKNNNNLKKNKNNFKNNKNNFKKNNNNFRNNNNNFRNNKNNFKNNKNNFRNNKNNFKKNNNNFRNNNNNFKKNNNNFKNNKNNFRNNKNNFKKNNNNFRNNNNNFKKNNNNFKGLNFSFCRKVKKINFSAKLFKSKREIVFKKFNTKSSFLKGIPSAKSNTRTEYLKKIFYNNNKLKKGLKIQGTLNKIKNFSKMCKQETDFSSDLSFSINKKGYFEKKKPKKSKGQLKTKNLLKFFRLLKNFLKIKKIKKVKNFFLNLGQYLDNEANPIYLKKLLKIKKLYRKSTLVQDFNNTKLKVDSTDVEPTTFFGFDLLKKNFESTIFFFKRSKSKKVDSKFFFKRSKSKKFFFKRSKMKKKKQKIKTQKTKKKTKEQIRKDKKKYFQQKYFSQFAWWKKKHVRGRYVFKNELYNKFHFNNYKGKKKGFYKRSKGLKLRSAKILGKFCNFFSPFKKKLQKTSTIKSILKKTISIQNFKKLPKIVTKGKGLGNIQKQHYMLLCLKAVNTRELRHCRGTSIKKKRTLEKKRKKLWGYVSFFNMWIGFFHTSNLIQLKSSCSKNLYIYLNKNFVYWSLVQKQKKYSLYFWYNFYSFKSYFSKIKNINKSNFNSKTTKEILLISISFEGVSLFIYLLNNYLLFLQNSIFNLIYTNLLKQKSVSVKKNIKNLSSKLINLKKLYPLINRGIYQFLSKANFFLFNFTIKNLRNSSKNKLPILFYHLSKVFYLSPFKYSNKSNLKLKWNKYLLKPYLKVIMLNLAIKSKNFFSSMGRFFNKLNIFFNKILFTKNTLKVFFVNKIIVKNLRLKKYLIFFNSWLHLYHPFNKLIHSNTFRMYNTWVFYLNYSLNYYLFSKLYFAFFNYFFYIICQKFMQISSILRFKKFEIVYDFSKAKDNIRYHLGIRPQSFVTTFNRRVKKGLR